MSPDASATPPVVNVAAYRFAPLDRLAERREELRTLCEANGLKGTVLLSAEGINLFVAGARVGVDALLEHVRADPLLADIDVKESISDRVPFRRMLVKIKREIIAFGEPGIEPARETSPKLPAAELKRWLDEGRPVTLLDTRNDYEIALGTFEGAESLGLDHFREFPAAVAKLPPEAKERPVVMFCTGGVRCEKAGPLMQREGFDEVYQLDGGILKYFEECGGSHYRGDCFVFDRRVALSPDLKETAAVVCEACLSPLTAEEQRSPNYRPGRHCPRCFVPPQITRDPTAAEATARIRLAASPLPGNVAYTNERPLTVPGRYDGRTLIAFLDAQHPHVGSAEWRRIIVDGELRRADGTQPGAEDIVRGGERFIRLEPDTVEPQVAADMTVLAWTPDIVAIDKPAPLPMHPCGRFNRNTLSHFLELAFPAEKLRPVHRLDANTTGVVLLARSKAAATALQRQFEDGTAEKTYRCRVHGRPDWSRMTCAEPISASPAEHGHRVVDPNGREARTEFRVLEAAADSALIEARPLTGRTNQIRVHLWHLGHPIVGDPAYRPGGNLGRSQTLATSDPPMCLHAARLVVRDPASEDELCLIAADPKWSSDGRVSAREE